MVGRSAAMHALFDRIERAAALDGPVLIRGELGTEKELVAAAIHRLSARRRHAFEVVDCRGGSGPWLGPMVLSDLVGCAAGVLAAETPRTAGALTRADGGTVFLYEAAELSIEAQRNVLRLIEVGEMRALGSATAARVDARVLAATCDHLEEAVERGSFHRRLYHRLCPVTLRVPPVRARREDIPLLVDRIRLEHNERLGLSIAGVTSNALAVLEAHHWPGNLEEMRAVLVPAMVLVESGWLGRRQIRRLRSRRPRGQGGCPCRMTRPHLGDWLQPNPWWRM
jgi:DNA-binding NtrC family response regulator